MTNWDKLHKVDTPRRPVCYRDIGSGQPVVFVHGLMVGGELWRRTTESLSVLVAWGTDDRLYFPTRHGRRLAAEFPQGRFVPIARSRAFVPLDRPDETARLIRDLAATSAAES
jgi:pimeloyl-ACP methyl ester carboxylesterase